MFIRTGWPGGLLVLMLLFIGVHAGYAQDTVSTADVEFTPMTDSAVTTPADTVVHQVKNAALPVQAVVKGAGEGVPQSLWAIFIAGLLGGFAAVLMPCIFP